MKRMFVAAAVMVAVVFTVSAQDARKTGETPFVTKHGRMDRSRLNIGTYSLQPYARTEAHVKDLKECGIDFVIGMNGDRAVLDLFSKYGVGAIVSGVVPGWWGGNGDNAGKMAANDPKLKYEDGAAGFADHPAIWSIDVGDEPSALDFPYYGKVIERVEQLFPNQFAYLNLYPNYASVAKNTSDQTVIQRYMTTSSEKAASKSIITNGFLSIFVSIIFYTIGTGLYTFFKTHPAAIDVTMQKTDAIFPFFMMSQLPAGLAGLLIAALFAATMSTISSNINSISTAFTMDMYKKWRPQIGDRKTLSVARWTGIVAGLIGTLIAIVMAVADIQSLLDYFNTILGLLTGAIGGLFIMGIFFKRINAATALIGFIAGTLAVFYMNYFTDANFLLFGFISMFVSVAVALVLSLFSRNRKDIKGLTWKTLDKIEKLKD